MNKFLLVAIGGAVGSVARFGLGSFVATRLGARFPYGTFIINVTASFLIGFLLTVLAEKTAWSPGLLYLLSIGFLGGYSTFSTFEYETFRAFQSGEVFIAALNVVLSVGIGFAGVWLGYIAGRLAA